MPKAEACARRVDSDTCPPKRGLHGETAAPSVSVTRRSQVPRRPNAPDVRDLHQRLDRVADCKKRQDAAMDDLDARLRKLERKGKRCG